MKKKKKLSTSERADQFLNTIGTAGGIVGSPDLIGFGGSDLAEQVFSGNRDEYENIRMRQGDTRVSGSAAMPSDLDASYLKLNLPGSPLPANAMFMPQNINNAQVVQKQIAANEQIVYSQNMPLAGTAQLPMLGLPPLES
tara:strand:+ start:572 stop:991 length:420 start_codon:yes stop_codon:yes gene_type:complete